MRFWRLVILAFIFILGAVAFFGFFLVQGPVKNQPKERFVIPLYSSDAQIVEDLVNKGFVKNETVFGLVFSFKRCRGKIAPGAYLLSKSMNAFELADSLMSGPYQKWVIIPPGKRKEQVALILRKELGWSDPLTSNFIQIAEEGYLYPDTYLINVDSAPNEVFLKLKNNFNEKFDAKLQQDLLSQNIRNDTAIKIASLIERESGGNEDKAIIAGIIWNRLEKKMKLEIDATIQYALVSQSLSQITNYQSLTADFDFWPILTGEMIRSTESSYNTYKIDGLPPGPICSPSLASIKAVAYPAETKALFYLHSPDKKIHTAETYEEHLQNIEKYLR
jgi:UPF0755 protein